MKKKLQKKIEYKRSVIWISLLALSVFCLMSCWEEKMPGPHHAGSPEYMDTLFIENLRSKDFSSSQINIIKLVEKNEYFSRYLIDYMSGDLKITGMMNVPIGDGPFPAVILNHGYYGPERQFSIGLGFKDAADIFARHGYVSVGSNFRNRGGSDRSNERKTIYDVLYLTDAAKRLPYVDKDKIGMWGYSGGGGLTLKAAVTDSDIKVITVFGSMSSDARDNYYTMSKWHPKAIAYMDKTIGSPDESPDSYARLSSIHYFKDVSTSVMIHHGKMDKTVPLAWSEKLEKVLLAQGKTVEFYTYPRQGHVLKGRAWKKAMERTIVFFNRYLKGE